MAHDGGRWGVGAAGCVVRRVDPCASRRQSGTARALARTTGWLSLQLHGSIRQWRSRGLDGGGLPTHLLLPCARCRPLPPRLLGVVVCGVGTATMTCCGHTGPPAAGCQEPCEEDAGGRGQEDCAAGRARHTLQRRQPGAVPHVGGEVLWEGPAEVGPSRWVSRPRWGGGWGGAVQRCRRGAAFVGCVLGLRGWVQLGWRHCKCHHCTPGGGGVNGAVGYAD